MNDKQRLSIWLAIGVIVILFLFPPARYFNPYNLVPGYESSGYKLIFSLQKSESVDFNRLILPIGAVIIIALGLIVTFRDKKPK
jgi:hypothetical protein